MEKKKYLRLTLKYVALVVVILCILGALALLVTNMLVINGTKDRLAYSAVGTSEIKDEAALKRLKDFGADCALVLGAGITDRETPSPILRDRLDVGVSLYKAGVVPKILLTGDNGQEGHNEIHVMLNYTLKQGVPAEDIFCDHAGFSTYDSMHRAKSIFHVKKAIVVTQNFHLYRAMYIGDSQGLETLAVGADQKKYSDEMFWEGREILARAKDVAKCLINPGPMVGGEVIPISGSGLVSHGE